MNEEQLRALVRESVARHLGERTSFDSPDRALAQDRPLAVQAHPSHYRYALTPSDGPCLIEPGVACNHCGYCESHGH